MRRYQVAEHGDRKSHRRPFTISYDKKLAGRWAYCRDRRVKGEDWDRIMLLPEEDQFAAFEKLYEPIFNDCYRIIQQAYPNLDQKEWHRQQHGCVITQEKFVPETVNIIHFSANTDKKSTKRSKKNQEADSY